MLLTKLFANRIRSVRDNIYRNQRETMTDLKELFTTMNPNYSAEIGVFANTIRTDCDNINEWDAVKDTATPPPTKKQTNK